VLTPSREAISHAAALLRATPRLLLLARRSLLALARWAFPTAAAALAAPTVPVASFAPLLAAMAIALAAPFVLAARFARFAWWFYAHRWRWNRGLRPAEPCRDTRE